MSRACRIKMSRGCLQALRRAVWAVTIFIHVFVSEGCGLTSKMMLRKQASKTPRRGMHPPRRGMRLRGGADLVQCFFEVWVPNTILKAGDTVVLLGSGVELHDWDESDPLELTQPHLASLPWWFTEVALPVGDTVAFKFGIWSEDGEINVEMGRPRMIVIPDDISLSISANFSELRDTNCSTNGCASGTTSGFGCRGGAPQQAKRPDGWMRWRVLLCFLLYQRTSSCRETHIFGFNML